MPVSNIHGLRAGDSILIDGFPRTDDTAYLFLHEYTSLDGRVFIEYIMVEAYEGQVYSYRTYCQTNDHMVDKREDMPGFDQAELF